MNGRPLLFLGLGAVAALGLGFSTMSLDIAKAQTVSPRGPVPAIATRAAVSLPSGEALFKKRCSGCHELDAHDRGPALRTVYGRIAGHNEGFRYSSALRTTWFSWDDANLDTWLQGPARMVPGARMRVSVRAPAERTAIIAYLKSVNSNPTQGERRP
jgi:cytochrome c